MSAVSPYFKSILLEQQKREVGNMTWTIDLSDFSPSAVRLLIDLIYNSDDVQCDDVNIIEFFQLTSCVQIQLFNEWAIHLARQMISVENCRQWQQLAQSLNIPKIAYLAASCISENFVDFMHTPAFREMSFTDLKALLNSELASFNSSDIIVDAVVSWTAAGKGSRDPHLFKIIEKCLRHCTNLSKVASRSILHNGIRSDRKNLQFIFQSWCAQITQKSIIKNAILLYDTKRFPKGNLQVIDTQCYPYVSNWSIFGMWGSEYQENINKALGSVTNFFFFVHHKQLHAVVSSFIETKRMLSIFKYNQIQQRLELKATFNIKDDLHVQGNCSLTGLSQKDSILFLIFKASEETSIFYFDLQRNNWSRPSLKILSGRFGQSENFIVANQLLIVDKENTISIDLNENRTKQTKLNGFSHIWKCIKIKDTVFCLTQKDDDSKLKIFQYNPCDVTWTPNNIIECRGFLGAFSSKQDIFVIQSTTSFGDECKASIWKLENGKLSNLLAPLGNYNADTYAFAQIPQCITV